MPARRLYVRDKVIFRSQVKENNHHPRWNEDFKFLVHEPQYQVWPVCPGFLIRSCADASPLR